MMDTAARKKNSQLFLTNVTHSCACSGVIDPIVHREV
jgi:hypothetical protein